VADHERAAGPGRGGGTALPVSRSFVVQFTPDTAAPPACFRGRVEHIDSGCARRFTSLDDLLAFIRDFLAADEADEGE
jgi:hypothetical protein